MQPMLVCFLKVLATGVGRYLGDCRGCPLLQSVIPWRISGIIIGGALFRYPQLERKTFSLSHVLSPLWNWYMCGTPSAGFPQSLGNDGEGHDSIVAIFSCGEFFG